MQELGEELSNTPFWTGRTVLIVFEEEMWLEKSLSDADRQSLKRLGELNCRKTTVELRAAFSSGR